MLHSHCASIQACLTVTLVTTVITFIYPVQMGVARAETSALSPQLQPHPGASQSQSVVVASALTSDLTPVLAVEDSAVAQQLPQDIPPDALPQIIPRPIPPEPTPLPQEPPPPLPPPEELLRPPQQIPPEPEIPPADLPLTVFVEQFRVEGSTVFDADELTLLVWQSTALDSDEGISTLLRPYCSDNSSNAPEDAFAAQSAGEQDVSGEQEAAGEQEGSSPSEADLTSPVDSTPTGQNLTFEQLLRARSVITQLYIKCGYITSGAILPLQTPEDQGNVVVIQVVEGSLEDIAITGLQRLNPGYVRSRLAIASSAPLNQRELVQGLQLLQLDPLIRRISADLQAGTRPGTNILQVSVTEANTVSAGVDLDNSRSPSVGTDQRGITFNQANLLGLGDGLSITYSNTNGSNGIEGSYRLPINPRNGTLSFRYGYTRSRVIEEPFDILDITARSYFYEATFRQPIFQIPTEELALGLTFSRQESQTELGIDDIGPFPLARGADEEGRSRISAIRFTQEWLRRDPRQVLAFRSQFSVGLDLLNATINDELLPDGRFFAWRGQGQWVRLLNDSGTLLLVRTDVQLTGDSLLALEQFGLGGQETVRGYRQDALLTDNGVYASVETRFPIIRVPQQQASLQLIPFLGAGIGWNADSSDDPDNQILVGTGIGVLWEDEDLAARLDFGIPLTDIDTSTETWQESGVYFSIQYSFL